MDTLTEFSRWKREHYKKLTYTDPNGAQQAIWELRYKGISVHSETLHPYLCTFCHQWHVGHEIGKGEHGKYEPLRKRR